MSDQQITNYQKMLLKKAYCSLTEDSDAIDDDIKDIKRLSSKQLDAYKAMNKEIENKPLPMFSKKIKDYKPEDFFDEEGNEVKPPEESQEDTPEKAEKENSDAELENSDSNCFSCRYFYVTWDPQSPRGCKFFKFKTELMPSEVVHNSLGDDCKHYFNKFSQDFESIFATKIDSQELPPK